jgi:hypothetical protein
VAWRKLDDLKSPKSTQYSRLVVEAIEQALAAKLLQVAAWLAFALIVFATLAPLHSDQLCPAQLERFAAFAMVGLFFGLTYAT